MKFTEQKAQTQEKSKFSNYLGNYLLLLDTFTFPVEILKII